MERWQIGIWPRASDESDTKSLNIQSSPPEREHGSLVLCWLTFHRHNLRALMISCVLTLLYPLWNTGEGVFARDICGRLADAPLCSDNFQPSRRLGDLCSAAVVAGVFDNRGSILNALIAIYTVATLTKQLRSNFLLAWPDRLRPMRRSRTWKLRITILFMRLLVAVCEISIYKSVHQYVAERSNLTKVPQGLVVSLACRIFGITVQAFVVSTLGALLKNNLGRERLRDHVRQIVQSVETVREFAVPLYIILMRGRFPGGYDPFWPQTGYVEETHVPGGGYIELAWYLTVSLAVLALHRWTFLRTTCSGPDSFTASFLQLACVTVFTAAFPPASVIAYVMTSLELRARERSTCSSESVPCDLDQWCDKFSSLCRAVVFINTLVVAFSSEIVPMWFFAHRTGSLEGYTDFKMQSVTSVADSVSTNTTTCFVHAYADLAKRHKKFNDSHHVLLFRMGFAIVFQNVVLIVTTFISQHA